MQLEDYTQSPVQEDATFRAFPLAWTIEQATGKDEETGKPSQSVAIAIRLGIAQKWHGKEAGWSDKWPIGWFTDHRAWVVKKDGTLNEGAIANLKACGLWDGDWDKIAQQPPAVFVLADVSSETYAGKPRWRANWINPNADEPAARGGFKPASSELLQQLRSRFPGARAIGGGAAAGQAPPPPRPTPAGAPQMQPQTSPAPAPMPGAAAPAGYAPAPGGYAPAPAPAAAPAPGGGYGPTPPVPAHSPQHQPMRGPAPAGFAPAPAPAPTTAPAPMTFPAPSLQPHPAQPQSFPWSLPEGAGSLDPEAPPF